MAGGSLERHAVAAWGLTFKARTDDIRDSPALRDRPPTPGTGRRGHRPTTRRSTASCRRSTLGIIESPPTRTPPVPAPRCSRSSPSGTSSSGSTSTRSAEAHDGQARRRRPQPDRPHGPRPTGLRVRGHRSGLTWPAVVVTGGAGFLGSHLCERSSNAATRSSASTTWSPARSRNVEHLFGDRASPSSTTTSATTSGCPARSTRCCTSRQPGVAGRLPRAHRRSRPSRSGSLGTHNTLGLAKAKGARFFLAST